MISFVAALVVLGALPDGSGDGGVLEDGGVDAGPGIVLEASSVVATLPDGGIVELAPALVLDETAGIRIARELAGRRAAEPVLRSTEVTLPPWLVPVLSSAFLLTFGAGFVAGFLWEPSP